MNPPPIDLSFVENGIQHRGQVTIVNSLAIAVLSIEPVPQLRGCRSMPVFAAPFGRLAQGSELTAFGLERAKETLRAMAAAYGRFQERRDDWLAVYRRFKQAETPPIPPADAVSKEVFQQLRRVLRRELRAGLDPRSYQRRLEALKDRAQQYQDTPHPTNAATKMKEFLEAELGEHPGYIMDLLDLEIAVGLDRGDDGAQGQSQC